MVRSTSDSASIAVCSRRPDQERWRVGHGGAGPGRAIVCPPWKEGAKQYGSLWAWPPHGCWRHRLRRGWKDQTRGRPPWTGAMTGPERYSGSRLIDEIDGRGDCRAKAGEPAARHDFAGTRLTGLRAQRKPHFLRQRAGCADQRGSGVVRATDGVQVVLDPVARVGFDDHPRAIGCEG